MQTSRNHHMSAVPFFIQFCYPYMAVAV